MAEIGHGVIGDPLYGRGSKSRLGSLSDEQRHAVESLNHQALHAYIIGFTPIPGADTLRYESAIHSDINCLLEFFAN